MLSQQCESNPVENVLAGDVEATALFDALAKLGVEQVKVEFRVEDGSPHIDVWMVFPEKGRRLSASLLKAVGWQMHPLAKLMHRGLEMALGSAWEHETELVANGFVDVSTRRIILVDIRELVYGSDLPDPERGIVL